VRFVCIVEPCGTVSNVKIPNVGQQYCFDGYLCRRNQ